MLKAVVVGGPRDRKLLVLGFSRQNCELLLEGKPILFALEEVLETRPPLSVLVLGGEDERDLAGRIAEATTEGAKGGGDAA